MNDLFQALLRLIESLLLGCLQGVTEVFPISSSAHLALAGELRELVGRDQLAFEIVVFLHLGTSFAILLFYRREIAMLWRILVSVLVAHVLGRPAASAQPPGLNRETPFLILLALLATFVVAYPLKGLVELTFQGALAICALMLLNGIILAMVGRVGTGTKKLADLGAAQFVCIGLAQGFAVFPGISRLGMTLCAGLLLELSWTEALKLSFLLSLPAALGAIGLEIAECFLAGQAYEFLADATLIAGIVAAGATGFVAMRLLLRESLHTRNQLSYFGYYCMLAGVFFFVFFKYLG
jgi:undecaprenyl-diphosphatase